VPTYHAGPRPTAQLEVACELERPTLEERRVRSCLLVSELKGTFGPVLRASTLDLENRLVPIYNQRPGDRRNYVAGYIHPPLRRCSYIWQGNQICARQLLFTLSSL